MSRQQSIRERLQAALTLEHLEIINESHMHSGPPNRETHFKVVLVSPESARLGAAYLYPGRVAGNRCGPGQPGMPASTGGLGWNMLP